MLAYNVAQSSGGCDAVVAGLRKYHVPTPVVDFSIPYGAATLDADVTRMQQAGVDFVATCMDATGNIKLSQTLQQHGMGSVTQYWLDGYDSQILRNNTVGAGRGLLPAAADALRGDRRSYPGVYPGIDAFNAALRRYAPGYTRRQPPPCAGWVERRPVHRRAPGHRQRRHPHGPGPVPQQAHGLHGGRRLSTGELAHRPHRGHRPRLHQSSCGPRGTGSCRSSPPRRASTPASTRPGRPTSEPRRSPRCPSAPGVPGK